MPGIPKPTRWEQRAVNSRGKRTVFFVLIPLGLSIMLHALVLWALPGPLPMVNVLRQDILLTLWAEPAAQPELASQPKREHKAARNATAAKEAPAPKLLPVREQSQDALEAVIALSVDNFSTIAGRAPGMPVHRADPALWAADDALPAAHVQPTMPAPEPEPEPKVEIEAILREWQAGIKAAIEAQKQYPAIAERLGHTGSVKFRFSLDAGGGLLSVSVKSSSGWEELDAAALNAVRAAAPFASIPQELGRDELALSMTLRFKLD